MSSDGLFDEYLCHLPNVEYICWQCIALTLYFIVLRLYKNAFYYCFCWMQVQSVCSFPVGADAVSAEKQHNNPDNFMHKYIFQLSSTVYSIAYSSCRISSLHARIHAHGVARFGCKVLVVHIILSVIECH